MVDAAERERYARDVDDATPCHACGEAVAAAHRYCPWCAAPLRRKLTAWFRSDGAGPRDADALRVSVYRAADGNDGRVRISAWERDGQASAAVSLDADEAARLARFVLDGLAERTAAGERDEATRPLDA